MLVGSAGSPSSVWGWFIPSIIAFTVALVVLPDLIFVRPPRWVMERRTGRFLWRGACQTLRWVRNAKWVAIILGVAFLEVATVWVAVKISHTTSTSATTTTTLSTGTHWAADITAAAAVITATGVAVAAVGAFWAVKQVKEVERSRHAATALEISLRWGAPDLVESRKKFWELAQAGSLHEEYMAASDPPTDAYFAIGRLMDFFEDLALLEDIGGISLEWICRSMGPTVLQYWETWKFTAKAIRKKEPEAYVEFQALVQKVKDAGNRWKPLEALD